MVTELLNWQMQSTTLSYEDMGTLFACLKALDQYKLGGDNGKTIWNIAFNIRAISMMGADLGKERELHKKSHIETNADTYEKSSPEEIENFFKPIWNSAMVGRTFDLHLLKLSWESLKVDKNNIPPSVIAGLHPVLSEVPH
jgi:hypothetical protein